MATGTHCGEVTHCPTDFTATMTTCSPETSTPRADGTCCRAMMTAIPRVKPSITGSGMKRTYRPSPAMAMTTSSRPAMRPTTSTPLAPYSATIGTSTTVMAPVGPEICRLLPPKTAATVPATIAVISPAAAPRPDVIPKANANGKATTPTVMPAMRSRPGAMRMAR